MNGNIYGTYNTPTHEVRRHLGKFYTNKNGEKCFVIFTGTDEGFRTFKRYKNNPIQMIVNFLFFINKTINKIYHQSDHIITKYNLFAHLSNVKKWEFNDQKF